MSDVDPNLFTRAIPSLIPRTRYGFRVRSHNLLGVYSDWSEVCDFTAEDDNSTPLPPTNLIVDSGSGPIIMSWTAPTHNTDGTLLLDLGYYQLYLTANDKTVAYTTSSASFVYTLSQNIVDFGAEQFLIYIAIYTVDTTGNTSADALTGTSNNPQGTSGPWVFGSAGSSASGSAQLVGTGANASGSQAVAEGQNTTASGTQSHAEGTGTIASSLDTHAEGSHSQATNNAAHAEGDTTVASGVASHAEGHTSQASGAQSHAEGSATVASQAQSHAEGSGSIASGAQSHAEGVTTSATGIAAHAEGTSTTASGISSHAEGSSSTASGVASHAEGAGSKAVADRSHAGGSGAITYMPSQFAHGGVDSNFALARAQYNAITLSNAVHSGGPITLRDSAGNRGLTFPADFKSTIHFWAYVVARRFDIPGTASVWKVEGVVDGNGASAYRFVGGVPNIVLVSQDTAASTWSATPSMVGDQILDFTVDDGGGGKTTYWEATIYWEEVA